MKSHKKSSVLVCVTAQHSCDRLIKIGADYCEAYGKNLHVLLVHPPIKDYIPISSEIEYLYQTAKDLDGEMTVMFDDNAPKVAADFARKIHAKRLVTGMPDGRLNGFIVMFHQALPEMPISMVSKENVIYNMAKENQSVHA